MYTKSGKDHRRCILGRALRAALSQAVVLRKIPYNVAGGRQLRLPKFAVMVTVGLRPGEVCSLKWSDLSGNRLRVQRALSRYRGGKWPLLPPRTKRSRRVVVLPEMAVRALKVQRTSQAEARLLLGKCYNTELGLIFATHTGEPLDLGNVNHKSFKPLLRRCKLPPVRLYDLWYGGDPAPGGGGSIRRSSPNGWATRLRCSLWTPTPTSSPTCRTARRPGWTRCWRWAAKPTGAATYCASPF